MLEGQRPELANGWIAAQHGLADVPFRTDYASLIHGLQWVIKWQQGIVYRASESPGPAIDTACV